MANKPDSTENVLRIGCGGIFGLLFGSYVGIRLFLAHDQIFFFILTILLFALIFGYLSFKNGDSFWENWR